MVGLKLVRVAPLEQCLAVLPLLRPSARGARRQLALGLPLLPVRLAQPLRVVHGPAIDALLVPVLVPVPVPVPLLVPVLVLVLVSAPFPGLVMDPLLVLVMVAVLELLPPRLVLPLALLLVSLPHLLPAPVWPQPMPTRTRHRLPRRPPGPEHASPCCWDWPRNS